MARYVRYRCSACEGEFDFLHHPSDEPPPSQCELCGAQMSGGPTKVFVPHINLGTAKGRNPDLLYRRMEAASEARAADAADMLGVSASEMSAIKITNMHDNLREGDVAAVTDTGAERRVRDQMARAAAEASANLSHVRVGSQAIPTGAAPHLERMSPEQAAAYGQMTGVGPAARQTRSIIDDMQGSGMADRIMAASTANGQIAAFKGGR